jgi:hypothetical protein
MFRRNWLMFGLLGLAVAGLCACAVLTQDSKQRSAAEAARAEFYEAYDAYRAAPPPEPHSIRSYSSTSKEQAAQLGEDPEPDPDELDPGLFVALNTVENPQELQMLTLDVLSDDSLADQVRIAWTEDPKVDVFTDSQGTQPVVTEQERTFDVPALPQVLYVEGTDHSDEVRDIDLTLGYLHDGEVLYTDLIKTTVVRVDLDIANGGSDLDLGDSAGAQPMTVLPESDEEVPGSYLLVNWDNDDGASPPQPDLGKNSVTDEDNLARLVLHLEPTLEEGALTLAVDSDPVGAVKLWSASTKEYEVTDPGWDLSQDTPPTELWVEGTEATTDERDVSLELRYIPPVDNTTFNDAVAATVVMINLGNAVYREAGRWWMAARGHAALVARYAGTCDPVDLSDDTNFRIIEMGGPIGNVHTINTHMLDTITAAPGLAEFGCYTNSYPVPSYSERLRILDMAKQILAHASDIGWCFACMRPEAWPTPHEVKDIKKLRCDGLVEVCYERIGINVWGAITGGGGPANYSILIDAYQAEHDNFDLVLWKDRLCPATQCGYEKTLMGTEWQSSFGRQDLCDPVGSTGGN